MAVEKTVLCVFRGRRRPITFESDENAKRESGKLLEAVLAGFEDMICEGQSTASSSSYHLERESEEWDGRRIDVSGFVRDKEEVYLCLSSESTVNEMSRATTKAIDSAKRIGKPSEANAKVLAGLFPGYRGAGQKRKFDPSNESVVAEQHRQKKAAFKGKSKARAKSVNVMIVEANCQTIPRGVKKEKLKDDGKAKVVEFFWYMNTTEVIDELGMVFSVVLVLRN
ncbi:uncharacterized protein [Dysidea avara]|uniref:uncharacterized protein n=1 Tax=Dysidea avara TaxID=196820 RepID=UPI00332B76EB